LGVRITQACYDTSSGFANVGTVEVEMDAVDKLLNMLFCQTCVCAGSTNSGTLVECLDGTDKLLTREPGLLGMGLDHLG